MLDESQFTMLDGEIPDGEMPYEEFEKIVLDYQLEEHIKFLTRFTDLFAQIDTDQNGLISQGEF